MMKFVCWTLVFVAVLLEEVSCLSSIMPKKSIVQVTVYSDLA